MVEKLFNPQQEIFKTEIKRNLDSGIALLRSEYETNPDEIKNRLGSEIGRLLVDELICQHQISKAQKQENSSEDSIRQVEKILRFYQQIMGEKDFMATKNGFLAEFAVIKAISVDAGFGVESSTEDEDCIHKTDLWVDLEGKALAVQVKCIKDIDRPYFIDLNLEGEFEEFYDKFGYLFKARNFLDNIEKIKQYSRGYENGIPVLIVLPSPGSDQAVFNHKTGKPDKKIGDYFYEEIDRRYLE